MSFKEALSFRCSLKTSWIATSSIFQVFSQKFPVEKKIQISLQLLEAEVASVHDMCFLRAPNRHL
jgi:hypothetical protein